MINKTRHRHATKNTSHLDLPELQGSTHLEATVPLGDAESLQRLRERTDNLTTRAAGASALIDADLPDDQ